ncbi:MAG: hypothetical protein GYB36_13320 [Alphaproteobacteria bacterium]|nr:hypothetical protein [Alphaproteobacteria bacterium]
MMFLIRACFWLAVVSVFVPKDFAGADIALPEMTVAENAIDASGAVSDWCENNSELCRAGEEAARLGGFLAEMAVDRIETAIEERETAASTR